MIPHYVMYCQQHSPDHDCLKKNTKYNGPDTWGKKFLIKFNAESYHQQNN